jgi:uncharacterized membrane protein
VKGQGDLRLACALAVLCAVAALLIPVDGVALVFAVPLLLILPGYAITAAAFARRPLPRPQFLLLSIALSLTTLVLGGLVLNYLGGIHPLSWALLIVLVVFASCRAAALRRGPGAKTPRWPRPRLARLEAAMLIGAVAATVAALVLASSTVPAGNALGYTQLWILPQAGSGGSGVQVGVRSQQQTSVRYDLRVRIGDERLVKRSFRLAPGESRPLTLRVPPGTEGTVPVIATLLRHNRPTKVYRRVKGSLTASEDLE